MSIKRKENLTKVMALGMVGGVVSPLAAHADTFVGPVVFNELTQAKLAGVREEAATAEDIKHTIKTGEEYTIDFTDESNNAVMSEGSVYVVYPTHMTTSNGELLVLDRSVKEVDEFVRKHTKVVTHDVKQVQVDFDGVYTVHQVKRAPGEFLNKDLQEGEDGRFEEYDKEKTLGIEFPILVGGLVSNSQTVTVNPKKTNVDGGRGEKPHLSEAEVKDLFGEVLVSKYGDQDHDKSGNVTGEDFNKEGTKLEGAAFRIEMTHKVADTFGDLEKGAEVDVDSGDALNVFEEAGDRNKAEKWEEVEDGYTARLSVVDGEIGLHKTGKIDRDIYAWAENDFDGLPEGKYTLTEVRAPEGYTINKTPIHFVITVAEDGVSRVLYVEDNQDSLDRLKDFEGFVERDIDGEKYYELEINNFLKPGTTDPNNPTDPNKPVDPDKPNEGPFVKTSSLDDKVTADEGKMSRLIAPGRKFDYDIDFFTPKDINTYKYLELYDHFDENIIVPEELEVEVKVGDTVLASEDFAVHKQDNKVKVVFAESGIGKLEPNGSVSVKFKDLVINPDLTVEETNELEQGGIDNKAKVHFENETGFVVNPKDPDKPVSTDPNDPDNPHVTPNPEDPFTPGDPVEPNDPRDPEESEKERPKVPESIVTKVIPSSHDFKFTKVNKNDEKVKGAKFAIVEATISSELGKSEEAFESAFDIEKYESLIEAGEIGEAEEMVEAAEEQAFIIDGSELNGRKIVATSDEDGLVHFPGLPAGEYVIREIQAPDGYRLSKEPITVTIAGTVKEERVEEDGKIVITKAEVDTTLSAEYDGAKLDASSDGENSGLEVTNFKYNETPNTGTLGKVGYMAAGTLVIAVGALASRKKED